MWCNWMTMGFWGWTAMIVFWAATVALVVWMVRSPRMPHQETPSSARSILEQRYASGEISREEFEERKRHLDESRPTGR